MGHDAMAVQLTSNRGQKQIYIHQFLGVLHVWPVTLLAGYSPRHLTTMRLEPFQASEDNTLVSEKPPSGAPLVSQVTMLACAAEMTKARSNANIAASMTATSAYKSSWFAATAVDRLFSEACLRSSVEGNSNLLALAAFSHSKMSAQVSHAGH